MANWRYENAGSLDLLINARGNTVNCYNKPQYSRTGIAFQQYCAYRQKNFDIPATTEIWIKFDFAFDRFTSGHRIYIGDLYNNKITGIYLDGSSSPYTYSRNFLFNGATVSCEQSILQKETLYRGLLHMRAGSSDGLIEWLDSEGHTLTYTGNVNDGNPFENLFVETYDDRYGTYCYISNVIISNQTVSINENVDWLPLNITFDLKSLLTSTATINFDLTRDVNVKAIWRYENYGSASLLKVSGTTVTGLDATKSKTGSAFWQKNRVATFDIPATKELWVKFDLYYGGTKWRAYDRLNGKDTGVGRYQQTNSLTSFINGPLEYTLNPKNTIATNTLKTYLLHMVSDAENGIVELWVDGVKYYSNDFVDEGLIYKGNVENGEDFANFYLQSDDANNLFSNVIISNARIGFGENVSGYNLTSYFDFDLAAFTTYSLGGNYDTKRNVSNTVSAQIDIQRNVTETANLNLDTLRDVISAQAFSEILNADACRILSNNVSIVSDIQRNITNTVDLVCDTRRRTEAVWRYENYGIADLLSGEGTFFTVENLDKSQAIYKTAFYQTERAKCFDIPATKEIWIKCDIWTPNRYSVSDKIYIGSDDGNGLNGWSQPIGNEVYKLVHNGSEKYLRYKLGENTRYRFLLHMKSGSSDGLLEVYIGGSDLDGSFSGNVNNGDDFKNVYISTGDSIYATGNNEILISNLIISNAPVDINENVYPTINLSCDTLRFFQSTCLVSLDTARNVLWQSPLDIDTYRFVTYSVDIIADIFSTVNYAVQIDCDVIRTLPHSFILSPVENSGGVPDTSNDAKALTQSIEIRLNEQSLTDEVVIVTVKPVDIMEQVQGQYLDYKFNMRVETCKQRGILNTCSCCSDIDEILFKQLEYTIPEEEYWRYVDYDALKLLQPGITSYIDRHAIPPPEEEEEEEDPFALASTHISTIANILGKQPILRFDDFISTVDITAGGTTYNDLIRSIFGWTARIPHLMINCFIRDDKLFVVQRGHEQNVIDLTYLRNVDFVGTDRELVRTMWGSSPWSKTETREVLGYSYWVTHFKTLPEPDLDGETKHEYSTDGLVTKSVTTKGNTRSTTEYDYGLRRGKKVLSKETTYVEELINGEWSLVDKRITNHDYLKNHSQSYLYSYFLDDDDTTTPIGNVISHSNGDSRITPMDYWFATRDENGNLKVTDYSQRVEEYLKQQRTLHGITLFDTSFPVHGDDDLINITNAIKWLNRRTMEIVTFNIFDYPHVFDFNDRFVLNGKTYFLKSNTALKTPRIVNKQTVSMVRWY